MAEIDNEILQDPHQRKVMVWLMPHMKDSFTSKNKLKEALKNKKITKQDLLDLIRHKGKESNLKHINVKEKKTFKYVDRNDNQYFEDSFRDQEIKKNQLKMMTIKEDYKVGKSKRRLDRNADSNNLIAKSSHSPLQTLPSDLSNSATSIKPSTWNEKDTKFHKNFKVPTHKF